MKIGLLQYSPEWEEVENNLVKIKEIFEISYNFEDVIILPEMTLTGFTMNSTEYAEEIDGVATKFFLQLSRKYRTNIFAGLIEKDDDKIYNSLVHFDDQGLIRARYRKIHPFSFAKEDEHYDKGKEIVITEINKTKIGLTICYDLRFPELYRLYGKERVDLIINIANWPSKRIAHWKHLLKSRSIENLCFTAGVNRIGKDPKNDYAGNSALFNPMGKELLMCKDEEGIFSVEVNLNEVSETRDKFRFLDDITLI